ncbi:hypothetical protein GCM10010406_40570 [Streptomyces thermolineatus]|uniref:Aminodeoxyfutalosine deaminase/Imidazolonepropionase-like composite domain-containing protein n=1 Tax=Streptomyces thermolineatus TaxID=44033 RepID=A0ABP5ZPI6_9ACTN
MLTVHAAPVVQASATAPPLLDGAVAVEDGRVVSVGPLADLTDQYPGARVRHWPGVLLPGLVNRRGHALLEEAYHPDPREADELGTLPLRGEALAALGMTEERWGAGARRGLQRMMSHGATAVSGPFHRPAVRTAVARSGLVVVPREAPPGVPAHLPAPGEGPAELAPLAMGHPRSVLAGALAPGARADLAVFDVPVDRDAVVRDAEEGLNALWGVLNEHGSGAPARAATATVLGGRLVHRLR